jgi:hypothetical protein
MPAQPASAAAIAAVVTVCLFTACPSFTLRIESNWQCIGRVNAAWFADFIPRSRTAYRADRRTTTSNDRMPSWPAGARLV